MGYRYITKNISLQYNFIEKGYEKANKMPSPKSRPNHEMDIR
jgi:hypothetical protein